MTFKSFLMWSAMMLVAVPVIAKEPAGPADTFVPNREFWNWFDEFADNKGDVLDPLDYDTVRRITEDGTEQKDDDSQTLQPHSLVEKKS